MAPQSNEAADGVSDVSVSAEQALRKRGRIEFDPAPFTCVSVAHALRSRQAVNSGLFCSSTVTGRLTSAA